MARRSIKRTRRHKRKRTRKHKRKRTRRYRRRHRKIRRQQKGGAMTCAMAANIIAGLQGPLPRMLVVHTHGGSPIIGGPSVKLGEGFHNPDNFVPNGLILEEEQYSHRDTEIRDFFTNVPDNLLVFTFTPPDCLMLFRAGGWWERRLTFLANPNWILANNAEYTDIAKLYMPGDTIYNLMISYGEEDEGMGFYEQQPEGFIRLPDTFISPSAPETVGGRALPVRTLAFVLGKISDMYATKAAESGGSLTWRDRPLAVYLPICSPTCCFPNLPIAPVLRQVEKKRKDTAAAARQRFKNFRNVVDQCNILYMPPFQHPGFGATADSWKAVNRLWHVVPRGRPFRYDAGWVMPPRAEGDDEVRSEDKAQRARELSQFLIPPKESLLDCTKFKSAGECENIRGTSVPQRAAGDNDCAWLPEWINDYYPTTPPSQCREIGKGKFFIKDSWFHHDTKKKEGQGDIHHQAGQSVVRKVHGVAGLRMMREFKQRFKELDKEKKKLAKQADARGQ